MTETADKKNVDFLVIDNQESRLAETEGIIQQTGCKCIVTAKSAKAAREILKKNKVNFVITELAMPCMDGIELLKLIRRNPDFFEIPVLLTLDQTEEKKVGYAREEQIDGTLVRPFSEEDLLGLIRKIIVNRKNRSPFEKDLICARLLLLQRKYDEAIANSKKILQEDSSPEAFYILSECYYRLRDFSNARNYLQKVMQTNPTSKSMHLFSKICRAENQCGDAVIHLADASRENPSNIDMQIDLAKLHLSLGMEAVGDKIFDDILQKDPSDLCKIKIGKAYLKHDRLDRAGLFLDKTVDPIPETVSVFNSYAKRLEEEGKLEESLKQYEKCLRIVPDNVTCLTDIGKINMKLGNRKKARKIFTYISEKCPDNQKAKEVLAYLDKTKSPQPPEEDKSDQAEE